nr:MucB/RseB C-terminal domain-containing protein [Oceanobacter mangrovi]
MQATTVQAGNQPRDDQAANSASPQLPPENSQEGSAGAQATPQQWLQRMARAIRQTSYQGVLVFGDEDNWHTLTISHTALDGMEYEKISHLTGRPKELIRSGPLAEAGNSGPAALVDPAKKMLAGVTPDTSLLEQFYDLRLAGRDRIAGHGCRKIRLQPLDDYRFGQNLWLDEDSGLLLRSDVVDRNGKVLERYQFAQIDIGKPVPLPEFKLPSETAALAAHVDSVPVTAATAQATDAEQTTDMVGGWQADWTPPGFAKTDHPELLEQGQALMYSDGLSAYTLFIDYIEKDSMPDFSKRWGATSAVVRHQQHGDRNMRITVVGEVPMATAKKIAWSVNYRDKK